MDDATGPSPPPGYQAGYDPPTAVSWWELLPGEIGLFASTVGMFGWLTMVVRDGSGVGAVFWRAATLDSLSAWGIYGALVVTIGVTLVLHETVHAIAARLLGCETRLGRQGLGIHVRLRGGFPSRQAFDYSAFKMSRGFS